MKVTNINGTSDNDCSCGSWLKHWDKFNTKGSKRPSQCPACGAWSVDDGAHVQKYGSTDQSWYIVPLCHSCNMKAKSTVLDIGDCALAPANKSLTCEK